MNGKTFLSNFIPKVFMRRNYFQLIPFAAGFRLLKEKKFFRRTNRLAHPGI